MIYDPPICFSNRSSDKKHCRDYYTKVCDVGLYSNYMTKITVCVAIFSDANTRYISLIDEKSHIVMPVITSVRFNVTRFCSNCHRHIFSPCNKSPSLIFVALKMPETLRPSCLLFRSPILAHIHLMCLSACNIFHFTIPLSSLIWTALF